MRNTELRKRNFWMAAASLALLLLTSLAAACTKDADINKLFTVNSSAPAFVLYKPVSGRQVDFMFSTPVEVLDAKLEPDAAGTRWTAGETVSLFFEDEHSTGAQMLVDMLVADAQGSTLSLLLPFRTMNTRLPRILINEVRTQSSSGSVKRGEFIELKTFTAGNLGALRVFIARNGIEEPVYEFPPVEVAAGEYITLHIRTYPEDNAVDELGGVESFELTKTTANANFASRDIWTHINAELLRQSDAVYILDQNGAVLDAVVFYNTEVEWEKYNALSQTVEMLAKQGAWLAKDGTPVENPTANCAALNAGSTPTRTLCRDETVSDSNTANDWYVCKDGGATPGARNNPARYTKK
ncbi:MAG: hypothetical protein LBG72_02235 [Spirochaetaceae bacterium]|jgi:hypothetical protein|nr:hypothetical protein [Spirochaetaceae bacterium]